MAGKHKGLGWKVTFFVACLALVYAAGMLFVMVNQFRFTDLPGFFTIYAAVGIYGTQSIVGVVASVVLFIVAFILKKHRI